MNQKTIPIIIPAYDPDERLITLLQALIREKMGPIILVDDGSQQKCQVIFQKAEQLLNKNGVVLKHAYNQGKGRALKTAFTYVLENDPTCIGVVTADSDGQHSPSCIKAIQKQLAKTPQRFVLGVRNFQGEDIPWKSSFGNKLTSRILRYVSGIDIQDTQTGLRGIPRTFMQRLLTIPGERFEFETEMLLASAHHYSIVQVPIKTIYDSVDQHQTHFRPIVDSWKIYKILGKPFLKYTFAAITSCFLDLVLFMAFYRLFAKNLEIWSIPLATVLARVLSAVYNYGMNYFVTFANPKSMFRSSCLYLCLAVAQMMASAFFVTVCVAVFFFVSPIVIKIIIDSVLFFVSYYLQRQYVFRHKVKE